METKELVQQAHERKYTEFDIKAKEILSKKISEKLKEKGYFDRLDHAKGIDTSTESNEL